MRIRRITTVVVATTALVGAGAVPALADTRVVPDARGDVLSLAAADDVSLADPAPGRRNGDVVALRLTNGPRAVSATMRYTELLRPRGRNLAVHLLEVRTGAGTRGRVDLLTRRSDPQGEATWSQPGRSSECPVSTSVSYRDDTVSFSIPRRCLGAPRWVRVGAGSAQQVGETLYVDDASLDGVIRDDVVLGARVRR